MLAPFVPGAQTALAWEAPGAGIAQSSPYKVMVLGFPLESVIDPAVRADVAREAVQFLLPNGIGTTTPPPTTPPPTPPSGTTAPAATGGGSGGSGGCSLGSGGRAPQGPILPALLLLATRRRAG